MDEQYYTHALNNFKQYFKEDLVGFLTPKKNERGKSSPKFKAVVAGGYGLSVLLTSKYDMPNKVVTKDIDITISTNKTLLSFDDCYDYWLLKVSKFIRAQKRPNDFKVVTINTGVHKIPVMGYNRYALIMISFKHGDFVDLVFTDQHLPKSVFDKGMSLKNGLPIKKLNGYLEELLALIYMENVSHVYPDLYDKRNPFDGWYSEKGKNDIERANLVCGLVKNKVYKKYCKIIEHTAIEKVSSLDWLKRDEYFKALEGLINMQKFLLKDTIDIQEHKNSVEHSIINSTLE